MLAGRLRCHTAPAPWCVWAQPRPRAALCRSPVEHPPTGASHHPHRASYRAPQAVCDALTVLLHQMLHERASSRRPLQPLTKLQPLQHATEKQRPTMVSTPEKQKTIDKHRQRAHSAFLAEVMSDCM